MPIGNLVSEVMGAYACTRQTAAAIIEVARTKGLVVDTGPDTVKIVAREIL